MMEADEPSNPNKPVARAVVACVMIVLFLALLWFWISVPRPNYRIAARDENGYTRYVVQDRVIGSLYRIDWSTVSFSLEDARKKIETQIEYDRRSEVIRKAKWRIIE